MTNKIKVILVIILMMFIIGGFALAIRLEYYLNEIVASYQTPEDEIDLEFDDDSHRYEVWVNNERYYVRVDEAILMPYDENGIYVEIARNGKCKLYFFIKWEVKEE